MSIENGINSETFQGMDVAQQNWHLYSRINMLVSMIEKIERSNPEQRAKCKEEFNKKFAPRAWFYYGGFVVLGVTIAMGAGPDKILSIIKVLL